MLKIACIGYIVGDNTWPSKLKVILEKSFSDDDFKIELLVPNAPFEDFPPHLIHRHTRQILELYLANQADVVVWVNDGTFNVREKGRKAFLDRLAHNSRILICWFPLGIKTEIPDLELQELKPNVLAIQCDLYTLASVICYLTNNKPLFSIANPKLLKEQIKENKNESIEELDLSAG